jgi:hypothetical protein
VKQPVRDQHGVYGWTWGNLEVIRMGDLNGTKCLQVQQGKRELQIYVSPTGRSIRVFLGDRELK